MAHDNVSIMKPATHRKYPKGKKAAGAAKPKVAVRKPRTTGKAMPNKQKPVKTPMKKEHRVARASSAKHVMRKGAKGPVKGPKY